MKADDPFRLLRLRLCVYIPKEKSQQSLSDLVEAPGCKFAYYHFRWSNPFVRDSIEEFWRAQMKRVIDSKITVESISGLKKYV